MTTHLLNIETQIQKLKLFVKNMGYLNNIL